MELLLGLRSMYRPMTPQEVQGRNDWIIIDIEHTANLLRRFNDRAVGLVITNGYRGDYATWPVALERGVLIGTVDDVEDIAADPSAALDILKQRVGFDPAHRPPKRPDLIFKLNEWHIKLTV